MDRVEASYARLVARLDGPRRALALELPRRLGVSARAVGGWEDFTALPPMRDLPRFAGCGAVDEATIERFTFAHHCAGFYGLLVDRLADGQAPAPDDLSRLRSFFLAQWEDALGAACGQPARARRTIHRAMVSWRRGLEVERAALRRQRLTPEVYLRCIRRKTRWLGVTACMLVERAAGRRRALQFQRCFDLMLWSLQCLDDEIDRDEDRELFGLSFAHALGYCDGALLRASFHLCSAAAAAAREGRFCALAAWLGARASGLAGACADTHPAQQELAGRIIAATADLLARHNERGEENHGQRRRLLHPARL
jgi:hypothetical protein